MNPEDLISSLGMGGGAPPAGVPGIPPEMGAAIDSARPSVTEGEPGGGEDPLITAIDAIQDAIDAESDQEDIQTMLQCQAKLQSILAKNQSEQDGMLQGKSTPRGIRKATAGSAGGEY